jgi:hypothetical protein
MSDKLRDELFKLGHILPSTDEELEELDKVIKKKDMPKLPEIFSSPSKLIMEESKVVSFDPRNKGSDLDQYEPMARVARDGKEIPTEVLARMEQDRLDSEAKQNEQRDR